MIWIFWLAFGFLCYPFVGYPLLLWVLSLVWGREHQQDPIRPSVSIIIAVFNGEKQIAAKLSNTLELDYPENLLEILVASDGSNDRTAEIGVGADTLRRLCLKSAATWRRDGVRIRAIRAAPERSRAGSHGQGRDAAG